MEIRCGNCNKLFRVSDDKITGKGIKFACTSCGEYVKITREDFESYTLSMTAVSALDMFEPKPQPSTSDAPEADAPFAETFAAAPDNPFAEAPFAEETTTEPQSVNAETSFDMDFLREREEPAAFKEPFASEQPEPGAVPDFSIPPSEEEAPSFETPSETSFEATLQTELETGPDIQLEQELTLEPPLEPQPEPKPAPVLVQDASPGPGPQPTTAPQPASAPRSDSEPEMGRKPGPEPDRTPDAAPAVPPAESGGKAVRPASPAAGKAAPKAKPVAPARSGMRMAVLIMLTLVILGLAGAGAFLYLQQPTRPAPAAAVTEPASQMITPEGLQLIDSSGSFDQNGDLLITGAVENATDRDQAAWLIVVEVLDAQGAAVGRIRMLNGKQLYTRSDFEILANRGAAVQDLKARMLEGPDIILPPKGKVPFELRYVQPPAGVASFIPTLQPFDQARLQREIEMETK